MEQGQAEHVVGRLVPAVLAVVEYSDSVAAVGLREVGPLLRVDLILFGDIVRALDGAGAYVVAGHRIGYGQREFRLQEGAGALPVHFAGYVDAVLVGTVV